MSKAEKISEQMDSVSSKMDRLYVINQINGMLQAAVFLKENGMGEAAALIVRFAKEKFPEEMNGLGGSDE